MPETAATEPQRRGFNLDETPWADGLCRARRAALEENDRVASKSARQATGCSSGSIVSGLRRPTVEVREAKHRRALARKGSKAGQHVAVIWCRDLDLWSDAFEQHKTWRLHTYASARSDQLFFKQLAWPLHSYYRPRHRGTRKLIGLGI